MSAKSELQEIRGTLSERPKGPGRRIPFELCQLIGRYARARLAEGAARVAVAQEVGVSDQTIVRAMKMSPEAFLPVRVSAESAMIIRGPAGLTIEGLDIAGLAALLRALE